MEEGRNRLTGKPWEALQGEALLAFGFKSLHVVNEAMEGL